MTLSQTVYIDIKKAEDKGYFEMSPMEIFLENISKCEVENPIFSKEIVFIVEGCIFTSCGCGELDIEDAEDNDWEYCPYCGDDLTEKVNAVFKSEEEASKHKHYEELGCRTVLSVTARKENYTGFEKDELF